MYGVGRVGSGAPEIALDHGLKAGEGDVVHGELQFERTHLALRLVDLAEVEHALSDDRPGFVAVSVVADEEAMTRGTAGGGKTGLEELEKDEGGEGDGRMQLGAAMEGVCDENGKLWGNGWMTGVIRDK